MNNVLGIIAEYNPFHNGHLHHLVESKKATNSDYCVAVISGNFTQRGETSIVDKWNKTQMAINNGVDLVIELPTVYATSSAENFAYGAVEILSALNIVDYLSFGSESGDISVLNDIAKVLCEEPAAYKSLLSHELSKGISFPKARENALMMYLNDLRRFANVLSSPNNILGIEYLKALKKSKSSIRPITVKRKGSNHNNNSISSSSEYCSASAIRNLCASDDVSLLENVMPNSSFELLNDRIKKGHIVNDISVFEKEIIYTLRKMSIEEIANLPDVSEGLEFALKSAANSCNSIVEFLNLVDTKRYTKTRIQRILLYAILGITKKDMQLSKTITPYIRVLGFNDKGRELLSVICKKNPKLEVITSVKKFLDKSNNKTLKSILEIDIWASDVYSLGFEYGSRANLDFTHKLIN